MYASPLRTPLIRTGKYGLRAAGAGGTKAGRDHEGVDIRAAVGTPVYPTIGGTVVQTITGWKSATYPGVSQGRSIFRPGMGGNQIVIRGDDGRDHNDGHLDTVLVKVGQRVETSTMIGRSGVTGVNEPHLHHGIWLEYAPNRWRSIDPTPLLPWDGDKFGELTIKARNPVQDVPAHGPQEPVEDEMSAEDVQKIHERLDRIAAVIGGSIDSKETLTDIARSARSNASAAAEAARWTKQRVGGSVTNGTITELLRATKTDPAAIAAHLTETLGERDAAMVADELSRRLSN